jgi:multicomponent Na+:H+ antiporter subunit F
VSEIISDILFVSTMVILLTMVFAMLRAFWGPSVYDRILAVNMFGTKTVILIGVLGYLSGRPAFLDIALVYAMMNFITTIAVLKYHNFAEPEAGGKSL